MTVKSKIEVKQSTVHGLGCFAVEAIAKGETVGLYEGLLMEIGPDDDATSPHFLYMSDDDMTVCRTCKRDERHFGILGTGLLRHINSSDEEEKANVDMRHAWVVAIKPIRLGEELLMHYDFEGFED